MIFFPLRFVLWSLGSKLGNLQRKWIWEEREEKALSESPATQRQLCKIAPPCESLQLFTGAKADAQNVSTGIAFLCIHLWDSFHIPKLIYNAITVLYPTDSPDTLKRWEESDEYNILVKVNASNRSKARNFSRTLQIENKNSNCIAVKRRPLVKHSYSPGKGPFSFSQEIQIRVWRKRRV